MRVAGIDEIDDFGTVEAGIEHIHRHQHLRVYLALELPDARHRIARVLVLAHIGDDVIGVFGLRGGLEVGEFVVEQRRQRFGMALGDGEDDGFAEQRLAQDALAISKAGVHHFAVFAHNGLVARRDGEFAFERGRVNEDMRLGRLQVGGSRKGVVEFLAGLVVQPFPGDVFAQDTLMPSAVVVLEVLAL